MVTITRSNQGHKWFRTPTTHNQYHHQVSISDTLRFPSYSQIKILKVKVTTARSIRGHTMTMHIYNPPPMSLPSINFQHLTFSEIWDGQDFIGQVTTARSKVKSRSQDDVTHLHLAMNVPTKYQLPTPYRFRDVTRIRFYRSRSLRLGQRSN